MKGYKKTIVIIVIVIISIIVLFDYNFVKKTIFGNTSIPAVGGPIKTPSVSHPIISPKKKITLYYANWCGHCKQFEPTWDEFINISKTKYPNLTTEKIECSKNEKCSNISAFPTVILETDGITKQFNGSRTVQGLSDFVEN